MKKIRFYKYQGTGNDFILIDNRRSVIEKDDVDGIARLCNRRFGIGGDGLILLQEKTGYDFEMIYFNSDGREGSMCGNGGRCIVAFARELGIVSSDCRFLAVDGEHVAKIEPDGQVALKMSDVGEIEVGEGYFVLDTGSPHYVIFVEDVSDIDVVQGGQAIRYSQRFRNQGINVNFVEINEAGLTVATYERGVEAETLSCGTGVTASALSYYLQRGSPNQNEVSVITKGGRLKVKFFADNDGSFTNIWLCGPAHLVFRGEV